MKKSKPENALVVGRLGSSYGIRGWLRIFSFTEEPESIFDYQPWFIERAGQWETLEIESWKYHNNDLIVKLAGYDEREKSATLTNCNILVESTLLPELEDGEYYWKDLMGCQVITTKGYDLGKVIELMETGSNDVLVVKANIKDAFGAKERLIPYLDDQFIKRIDLKTKQIEVDWDPSF